MKHSRNLNYENTNTQTTTHIIPNSICLLGSINYVDIPTLWSV